MGNKHTSGGTWDVGRREWGTGCGHVTWIVGTRCFGSGPGKVLGGLSSPRLDCYSFTRIHYYTHVTLIVCVCVCVGSYYIS